MATIPSRKYCCWKKNFRSFPIIFCWSKGWGGRGPIGIFKGMDLLNNVPVVIKYLTQNYQPDVHSSQFRQMGFQESRRRFEREAQAFEKLEKHRQAKEQAVSMLTEQAKRQIDQGKRESDQKKLKAGMALLKQGDELLCDRYFVKAYCLATGQWQRFQFSDDGFCRGKAENVAFMVMEYIEGINLKTLLDDYREQRTPVPIKVFVPVIEGVLEALDYCHTEGIIHRDIRPDNILITTSFKVRLTNLGRAKVEDMTQLTAQGAFVGTPGYAAPEGIIQGIEPRKDFADLVAATDHRFDIYSLGCVAYEILVGRPPFTSNKQDDNERDQEVLYKHLREEPLPPNRFRTDISEGISLLVMKMLAKKPEHRFTSARESLMALRATLSLGHKAGEFTQKLLDKLRTPQSEQVFPEPRRGSLLRKLAVFLLFFGLVAAICWFFYGEELQPIAEKYYRQARQQVIALLQKDKKERAAAAVIIDDLQKYQRILQAEWQNCYQLRQKLLKDFPVERNYPSPSPRVIAMLERSRENLTAVTKILTQAKAILENQGGVSALQWLEEYRGYAKKHADGPELLRRIYNKLRITYNLAENIKQTQEEEVRIRRTAHRLRFYLASTEEWFTLIDEKLAILNERYPLSQKYPTVAAKVLETLAEKRRKVLKIDAAVGQINQALFENNLELAGKLTSTYNNAGKDLDILIDMDDSISEVLKVCKRFHIERERKRVIDRMFLLLPQRLETLQQSLVLAEKSWKDLGQAAAKEQPPALLTKTNEQIRWLKENYARLLQLLNDKKEDDALALAEKFTPDTGTELIAQLSSFSESTQDRLRVAKASKSAEQQRQKSEKLQKRLIELLALSKQRLNKLGQIYQDWQTEIQSIGKEFPDLKVANQEKITTQTPKIQEWLTQTIQQAEQEIARRQLTTAYQVLSEGRSRLNYIAKYIDKLADERQQLERRLLAVRDEQQQKLVFGRCQRTLDKLEKYVQIITQQITPLEKEIETLKRDFQPHAKYPALNQRSQQVIAKGKKWISSYENKIQTTRNLLKRKDFSSALEVLAPFEGKRLPGYEQFNEELKFVQEDINKTREKSRQIKVNFAQITEAEKYLGELERRVQDLMAIIPQTKDVLGQLARYYRQDGYERADQFVGKYLHEAELELEHLRTIISQGKNLLEQRKYYQAISCLQPHSTSFNPGIIPLVPLLKTYLTKSQDILQRNRTIERDPQLRQKNIQKYLAEIERQKQRKQWEAPPGPWYDELIRLAENYTSLEREILSSIEGKGSSLVHAGINSNWSKIKEYKQLMAGLHELENAIRRKGRSLPTKSDNYKEKELLEYLRDGRKIRVDVAEDINTISRGISKLKQEIRSSWIEEETLRLVLRELKTINRKFNEKYQNIYGQLLNLAN